MFIELVLSYYFFLKSSCPLILSTGLYGTIQDPRGPYGTKGDQAETYGTIRHYMAPYGTKQNHMATYGTIRDNRGLKTETEVEVGVELDNSYLRYQDRCLRYFLKIFVKDS